MKVLIENSSVCFENKIEAADILVEDGKITAVDSFPGIRAPARILNIAAEHRAHAYIVHVSTPKGVCLCRN